MEKVDVVIAGAGIAGCLASRDLSKMGHKVVLLEKEKRAEMGHDWWDSVHLYIFDEVGLERPKPPELMEPTGLQTVHSPLGTTTAAIEGVPDKYNIDRKLLAQRQVKTAEEAGARFYDETSVKNAIVENGAVTGVVAQTASGEQLEFRSKICIDATGMSAPLRKTAPENFGFPHEMNKHEMFVTYREIHRDDSPNKDSLLVFGRDNGVMWIRRDQIGLVDFFAGTINFPIHPDPKKEVLKMISDQKGFTPDLVRAGSGALLPVRRGFDSFIAPGLVLCGDSACQCNPVDGSGIVSSLRAAKMASETIHAALENGRTDIEALWPYNAKYKKIQDVNFAKLHLLQKFMVSEPKANLESLFKRGIINIRDFFGTGASKEKDSKLKAVLSLLKLADRPAFIKHLVAYKLTDAKVVEHYAQFPEVFSKNEFDSWVRHNDELFGTIGAPYGVGM
ncbi:MAG TPA: NAD(P)/FAD-dependent oxidoreductase [bacterium]|nr:NAD(P)/FAD-dependent oxidoreductase [bacterium]